MNFIRALTRDRRYRVSSFQMSRLLMSIAFCWGATSLTCAGTGAETPRPLMRVFTIIWVIWMGALPSFTRYTFTA